MASAANPMDDLKRAISPAAEIIEEARQGRMYILVDAEDRENEGDLIVPAQFATPAAINFMAKHGRGLICLALTAERADTLGLEPMTPRNQTRHSTAFTVSIEAREGVTTGISAHDRARTIAVAIDPSKGAQDIVSPGHVFPLAAKDGGVLVRAGHTEASVDISRLAGLLPAAVICEIMSDDGAMARLPELVGFSQLHGLKIGTIAELIAYRRENDRLVEKVLEQPFESAFAGDFRLIVFRSLIDGAEHVALVRGAIDPAQETLVRMHRTDIVSDILGEAGSRARLVERALGALDAHQGAAAFVLLRDPDPRALSRRLAPHPDEPSPEDRMLREYGIGAQILRELGVGRMRLMSQQPTRIIGLVGYGLEVVGWRAFEGDEG